MYIHMYRTSQKWNFRLAYDKLITEIDVNSLTLEDEFLYLIFIKSKLSYLYLLYLFLAFTSSA